MEKQGEAAPTGCYKCGRPGHWSRDCPLSPTNPNPDIPKSSSSYTKTWTGPKPLPEKSSENPKKKLPRTRPKLTPELLLSNDGLGYVLRHFPRSFKYRGRGHEFIHKVEQVGATKRARTCMRELRERVSYGGDPTKLHEPPVEHVAPDFEPGNEETMTEGPVPDVADLRVESHDVEEMFDEIYRKATEEPSQSSQNEMAAAEVRPQQNSAEAPPNQVADIRESESNKAQITDEQKARMEANRLKALERIGARLHSSVAT